MKTLTRGVKKPQRSFVPIISFAHESFEIPVRRVAPHKPLVIGAAYMKLDIHHHSRQLKTNSRPIDAVQPAKNFLPSPSVQGLGLTCLPSGRGRGHPQAAPSSRHSSLRSQNRVQDHPAELGLGRIEPHFIFAVGTTTSRRKAPR